MYTATATTIAGVTIETMSSVRAKPREPTGEAVQAERGRGADDRRQQRREHRDEERIAERAEPHRVGEEVLVQLQREVLRAGTGTSTPT